METRLERSKPEKEFLWLLRWFRMEKKWGYYLLQRERETGETEMVNLREGIC